MDSLVALLSAAGPAHHEAFIETDGEDPEWPLWYAQYLRNDLNQLLGTALTKSELVYVLVDMERQRIREAPEADWPSYYAVELEARHRTGELG